MTVRSGRLIPVLLLWTCIVRPSVVSADEVHWSTDPPAALQEAQASGRLVLIRFSADWCGYCRKMERTTFVDPEVVGVLQKDFVLLLIDVDQHPDVSKKLRIRGLPALLIVTPEMAILKKITGYQTGEQLLPQLRRIVASRRRPDARIAALPAVQERDQSMPSRAQDKAASENQPAVRESGTVAVSPASAQDPAARRQQSKVSFERMCLTSVVEQRRLIQGRPEFCAEYRGQNLYFADDDHRDRFFRNPDRYWPALDGLCAVTLISTGQRVQGRLQYAAVFRDRVWLFASEDGMKRFLESPADIAARAGQAVATADDDPVRF